LVEIINLDLISPGTPSFALLTFISEEETVTN
jgi:hypothetical protein